MQIFHSTHGAIYFIVQTAQVSSQQTPENALIRRNIKPDINVDVKHFPSRLLDNYEDSCNEYHGKKACKADHSCYWNKKKHPKCNSHTSSSVSTKHSGSSNKSSSSSEQSGSTSTSDDNTSSIQSLTGYYFGIDTDDASSQKIELLCNEKLCDVTLGDSRFSTCERELGAGTFNTGVGIAKNVPVDSLDDFKIALYCLQEGETVIDLDDDPTTYLTGDIELLPGGGIRRTGPGFSYSKSSVPEIKDAASKSTNDKSINLNGQYRGIDLQDGSRQVRSI